MLKYSVILMIIVYGIVMLKWGYSIYDNYKKRIEFKTLEKENQRKSNNEKP